MRVLCWLGWHSFRADYPAFISVIGCLRCGKWFRLVQEGETDEARYRRVRTR